MAGREVERVEVVSRRLDLAAVDDAVAEPEEDVLDLAADLRDQVEPPARVAAGGEGHVDALGRQPGIELRPRELLLAPVDRGLEPLAHRVQRHPGLAVAHLAQRLLDRALPPEVLDAHGLDLVGRRRRRRGRESLALECVGIHEGPSVPTRSSGDRRPTLPSWRSTTPSRRSTTRGAPPSRRTSRSTSRRRSGARARSSSSRSDRDGSPSRSRRPGAAVIGVDLSEGMLAVARALAEEHGVGALVDLRVGDLREPPVEERVQLVICPFRSLLHMPDEEREAASAAGRARTARAGRAARLRRLRAEPRGHRGDRRALARARAGHLRAGRLGRERRGRSGSRCARATPPRRWSCTGSRRSSGAA